MDVLTQETTMPAIPSTSREIVADIAARIESGEYPPGHELPSYTRLAELYSVSVSTASRVYLALAARGLTKGVPGRGIFVAEPRGQN
jgi:GntR family transcriptional regulator